MFKQQETERSVKSLTLIPLVFPMFAPFLHFFKCFLAFALKKKQSAAKGPQAGVEVKVTANII